MGRTRFAAVAVAAAMAALVGPAVATSASGTASGTTAASAPAPGAVSGRSALTTDVRSAVRGGGVAAEARALAGYWTAKRMRDAISAGEQPSVKKAVAAAAKRKGASAAPRATGPAGRVAPAAPKTSAGPTTRTPMSWYPNYPPTHPVARTYGKVFFTNQINHLDYVCSATVVNSEGKSTVWTAGHCVNGGAGGTWHANWTFVPAYSNGYAPYGYWTAYQLWTRTAWATLSDLSQDLGVAIVNRVGGWRIVDRLGGQGMAWNQTPSYYAYAFGYPAAYPFSGGVLVGCAGTTFNGFHPGTIGLYCDMTGGSSGGAWLRWFDGNWGYINGENSFKFTNNPYYMYSPYYGDAAASLYDAARNISV